MTSQMTHLERSCHLSFPYPIYLKHDHLVSFAGITNPQDRASENNAGVTFGFSCWNHDAVAGQTGSCREKEQAGYLANQGWYFINGS
jgi:hypothetical protein